MFNNPMAGSLSEQFEILAHLLRQTIILLEECDERFWVLFLQRALRQVEAHRLSGATYILGCYGGLDTFSDLVLARHWEIHAPQRFSSVNARLQELRDGVFNSASAIASRRHW